MKNLFYREQEARQVLELDYKELAFECDKHMELRITSDRDLVNCYKSLQKLNEDCEALRAQLKELDEAAGAATGAAQLISPPRPDPSREWKKSKMKTEDLLALLNSGFIREKEMDSWRAAAGDPYPMEKSEDEIPMFARFAERGLALPASDFFKGLLGYYGVEYVNLNPNGIFHTAVFVHFCEAFLEIKPHWILFRKFFRVKPQPSASNPRVVGGAGIQMREDAAE
jgi:hypothetical protein